MVKHTLGPWSVNFWEQFKNENDSGIFYDGLKDGIHYYQANLTGCDKYIQIAAKPEHLKTSRLFGDHQGPLISDITWAHDGEEEAKANARLIAASPTMYEYIRIQAKKGCKDAKKIISTIE